MINEQFLAIFGRRIRGIVANLPEKEKLEEIRMRTGKPLIAITNNGDFFIKHDGTLTRFPENVCLTQAKDIAEALTMISDYSIYAFEEEIKKGYITIKGGHRIGLCGKTVIESNAVKTIKHISALNIRVSHEVIGAADAVMKHILDRGRILHTIIVSPPRRGKTTLLRDIVRQLSDGVTKLGFPGVSVAVVDERSEIAGSFMGVPQNDVGIRTDVLDCCPKALGMQMLLRSMSPDCVAVDEIGHKDDILAIEEMLNAGIKLICTVHGEGVNDLRHKPYLKDLVEKRVFDTVIVLAGGQTKEVKKGRIEGVYDSRLNRKQE